MQRVEMALVRAFSTSIRRRAAGSLKDGSLSTLGVVPNTKPYQRVMQLQQEWAKTPEVVIWQKKGFSDIYTYKATAALITILFFYGIFNIFVTIDRPKADV